MEIIIEEIHKETISLATALSLSKKMDDESAKGPGSAKAGPEEPLLAPGTQEKGKAEPQAGVTEKEKPKNKLKKIVHPFFRRYDTTKDNQLNKTKFSLLKKEVGEPVDKDSPAMETIFKEVLAKYNSDTDELITLKELKGFNVWNDGGIVIVIPSSGPSSVEGQQSEEEMLVMMDESGMNPSKMVSVLQLEAGTIVMWVCLIG